VGFWRSISGSRCGRPLFLAHEHLIFELIFGTTFNGPDLVAYAVGVGLGAAAHWLIASIPLRLSQRGT